MCIIERKNKIKKNFAFFIIRQSKTNKNNPNFTILYPSPIHLRLTVAASWRKWVRNLALSPVHKESTAEATFGNIQVTVIAPFFTRKAFGTKCAVTEDALHAILIFEGPEAGKALLCIWLTGKTMGRVMVVFAKDISATFKSTWHAVLVTPKSLCQISVTAMSFADVKGDGHWREEERERGKEEERRKKKKKSREETRIILLFFFFLFFLFRN
jgi:hypothetical protein